MQDQGLTSPLPCCATIAAATLSDTRKVPFDTGGDGGGRVVFSSHTDRRAGIPRLSLSQLNDNETRPDKRDTDKVLP